MTHITCPPLTDRSTPRQTNKQTNKQHVLQVPRLDFFSTSRRIRPKTTTRVDCRGRQRLSLRHYYKYRTRQETTDNLQTDKKTTSHTSTAHPTSHRIAAQRIHPDRGPFLSKASTACLPRRVPARVVHHRCLLSRSPLDCLRRRLVLSSSRNPQPVLLSRAPAQPETRSTAEHVDDTLRRDPISHSPFSPGVCFHLIRAASTRRRLCDSRLSQSTKQDDPVDGLTRTRSAAQTDATSIGRRHTPPLSVRPPTHPRIHTPCPSQPRRQGRRGLRRTVQAWPATLDKQSSTRRTGQGSTQFTSRHSRLANYAAGIPLRLPSSSSSGHGRRTAPSHSRPPVPLLS